MAEQKNKKNRLYTKHGVKAAQGILCEIDGQKALGTFEGEKIIGYTTLDELNREFYTRELHKVDFKN